MLVLAKWNGGLKSLYAKVQLPNLPKIGSSMVRDKKEKGGGAWYVPPELGGAQLGNNRFISSELY